MQNSCPKCNGNSVKNEFQKGVQRYKCKSCNTRYQLDYKYKAYFPNTNVSIKSLFKECCGIPSISGILSISKNTILIRMIKISNQIKVPYFWKQGCKFEIDELWSYVGSKENVIWITYAIERNTK